MTANAYFQDELRFLREVGPEFAQANPEIAHFLGDQGTDPDVERLLEGTAFLCGRIRQKLDDELPELTANLMSLLWPHYLRSIPSMAIVELTPDLAGMQAPHPVESGVEFSSVPIEGTSCRYRSAWPVKLRPWYVEDARLEAEAAKPVRLVVRLRTSEKVKLEALELDSVRFHLHGDARTTFALYLLLSEHIEQIEVSNGSSGRRGTGLLEPGKIHPSGLDRAEGVLPYPLASFEGYRLLQEYFAIKERFLFFDVKGLNELVEPLEMNDTLELAITFERRFESFPMVAKENLRLHCVPAINLFEHSAEPLRLEHERTTYAVRPDRSGVADARHLEIYSVDEVAGLTRSGTLSQRPYEPFYSFRHSAAADPRGTAYYQTHIEESIHREGSFGGTDTRISLIPGSPGVGLPDDETISFEVSCTNRHLPTVLRAGDISQPTDTSPAGVKFRNLSKPTATIPPPIGRGLHWRLLSHLSLNYVSLADASHLKALLSVYDFMSEHDAQRAAAHRKFLDGIVSVRTSFQNRLFRGATVRGSLIEMELNEDHFAGEGDAYLFSVILDRFFGLYATINACSQLTVRFTRSGHLYTFPVKWGEQVTPAGPKLKG